MSEYQFTEYFLRVVLVRRPYLRCAWCIAVIEAPLRTERQEPNRVILSSSARVW